MPPDHPGKLSNASGGSKGKLWGCPMLATALEMYPTEIRQVTSLGALLAGASFWRPSGTAWKAALHGDLCWLSWSCAGFLVFSLQVPNPGDLGQMWPICLEDN